MSLALIVAGLIAIAGLSWLAGRAWAMIRGYRGQARARQWREHSSWFRSYQVRVLGPALFRRWRPGKLLAHGYQRPMVIRARSNPFSRSMDRLRGRRARGRAGA